jgi:hypothetical protein
VKADLDIRYVRAADAIRHSKPPRPAGPGEEEQGIDHRSAIDPGGCAEPAGRIEQIGDVRPLRVRERDAEGHGGSVAGDRVT